jgi:Histidine kinase-, DNA gyrase B-, and HSP90-like ATPase
VSLAARSGGGARIRVVDNGPGIPADLLPDVFERFARGDSSRSRAAGSTGLGLAIVAAVVDAHDGTVDVASRPGETAFTVELPAAPSGMAVAEVGPADEEAFLIEYDDADADDSDADGDHTGAVIELDDLDTVPTGSGNLHQ